MEMTQKQVRWFSEGDKVRIILYEEVLKINHDRKQYVYGTNVEQFPKANFALSISCARTYKYRDSISEVVKDKKVYKLLVGLKLLKYFSYDIFYSYKVDHVRVFDILPLLSVLDKYSSVQFIACVKFDALKSTKTIFISVKCDKWLLFRTNNGLSQYEACREKTEEE